MTARVIYLWTLWQAIVELDPISVIQMLLTILLPGLELSNLSTVMGVFFSSKIFHCQSVNPNLVIKQDTAILISKESFIT